MKPEAKDLQTVFLYVALNAVTRAIECNARNSGGSECSFLTRQNEQWRKRILGWRASFFTCKLKPINAELKNDVLDPNLPRMRKDPWDIKPVDCDSFSKQEEEQEQEEARLDLLVNVAIKNEDNDTPEKEEEKKRNCREGRCDITAGSNFYWPVESRNPIRILCI